MLEARFLVIIVLLNGIIAQSKRYLQITKVLSIFKNRLLFLPQVALHLNFLVQFADVALVDTFTRDEPLHLSGDIVQELLA